MLVGDDRDQPAGDRMLEHLADQRGVALVVRMHRDRHVGKHRLGPGGGDMDRARSVGERIFQVPEMAGDLAGLDLQVADRGLEPGVPVDQALVAVGEPALVELDEHFRDGAKKPSSMVKRSLDQSQLAPRRRSWRVIWPPLSSFHSHTFSTNSSRRYFGALVLALLEVALDHHLRGDSGMVRADHPQRILALHPGVADEDVLQRIVERMADVERAGDVGRRHDDGERLGFGPLGAEQALPFPMGIPAGLDRAGFERLGKLGHADAPSRCRAAASTVSRHCERSEAIQSGLPRRLRLLAMTN